MMCKMQCIWQWGSLACDWITYSYLDFPFLIRTKTKIYLVISVVLLFNLFSHPNKNNPWYKCRVSLWKWPKTFLARPPRFSGSSSTSLRCRPSTHKCRRSDINMPKYQKVPEDFTITEKDFTFKTLFAIKTLGQCLITPPRLPDIRSICVISAF